MSREPQIPRFAVHATALGVPGAPNQLHPGHLPETEPEDVSLLGGADGRDPEGLVRLTPDDELLTPGIVVAEPALCDAAEVLCPVFANEMDHLRTSRRSREPTLVTWDED